VPPPVRVYDRRSVEKNVLTLRFLDQALERDFLDDLGAGAAHHYRIVMPIGLLLYLVIGLFERELPHAATRSLIRYGFTAPILLGSCLFGWAPPALFRRHFQIVATVGIAALMISVAAMICFGQGPTAAFGVMSIALTLLGAHTILMLRHAHATVAGVLATAAFLAGALVTRPLSSIDLVMATSYLVIANLLGFLGSRYLEGYRRSEFLLRREVERERARSERLLLNVLPEPIARRLKASEARIADRFPEVTVLFGDIVGFTPLSQSLDPEALVAALDGLFSAFDQEAERLGLEKIKTIGDAYMVVGGLPTPREDHARAVAEMALAMQAIMARHEFAPGVRLRMRIGVHTGPAVAGVIGKKKFAYDLWGDTVNTASRMESHGVDDSIQVSEATWRRLSEAGYLLERRGEIEVKGMGSMVTYWLRGRR
jgi:adenylate cyclase